MDQQHIPELLPRLVRIAHRRDRAERLVLREGLELAAADRNDREALAAVDLIAVVVPMHPAEDTAVLPLKTPEQPGRLRGAQDAVAPDVQARHRREMGKHQHAPALRRLPQHPFEGLQGLFGKAVALPAFRLKGVKKDHTQPLLCAVHTIVRILPAEAEARAVHAGQRLGVAAEVVAVVIAEAAPDGQAQSTHAVRDAGGVAFRPGGGQHPVRQIAEVEDPLRADARLHAGQRARRIPPVAARRIVGVAQQEKDCVPVPARPVYPASNPLRLFVDPGSARRLRPALPVKAVLQRSRGLPPRPHDHADMRRCRKTVWPASPVKARRLRKEACQIALRRVAVGIDITRLRPGRVECEPVLGIRRSGKQQLSGFHAQRFKRHRLPRAGVEAAAALVHALLREQWMAQGFSAHGGAPSESPRGSPPSWQTPRAAACIRGPGRRGYGRRSPRSRSADRRPENRR